jgi:hypothetical protein
MESAEQASARFLRGVSPRERLQRPLVCGVLLSATRGKGERQVCDRRDDAHRALEVIAVSVSQRPIAQQACDAPISPDHSRRADAADSL